MQPFRRCLDTTSVADRFVFSEEYLKSVGSDLALNILCAVANPLGAEGMLRIVRGALKSRDLTKDLKAVALPLVLVQVKLKAHDRRLALAVFYNWLQVREPAAHS